MHDTKTLADIELQVWDDLFDQRQQELFTQLPKMGLQELRGVARGLKMRGYSKLRRDELRDELRDRLVK